MSHDDHRRWLDALRTAAQAVERESPASTDQEAAQARDGRAASPYSGALITPTMIQRRMASDTGLMPSAGGAGVVYHGRSRSPVNRTFRLKNRPCSGGKPR